VTSARAGRTPVPAIRHVVFDLDGTLVDTAADLVAATNHVLGGFALPEVDATTLLGYVGDGARTLVGKALGPARGELLDEGVNRFLDYYRAHLLDASRPYPGMESLLRDLHALGVRASVLTNKAEALSRPILDGLGLMRWLDSLVGGDSLPTRKPDPAGLLALCERTGIRPSQTIVVGDSTIDLRTAQAGGAAFCGVAWGLAVDGLRAAAAEPMIAHPADLLAIVQRMPGSAA